MQSAMKTLILASTALMLSAGIGIAQTTSPSTASPPSTTAPRTTSPGSTSPGMTSPGTAAPERNARGTVSTTPPSTASLPADSGSRGVVGMQLRGPDDKSIGKIDNVIVSSNGKVHALVVDVGSVLGVGGKEVLVDLGEVTIDEHSDRATTKLTEDQLKAKPEYRAPSKQ